jgi:predicted nucleic acid-binding protein
VRVVSDTSALCYLILIDEIQILPALFTEIVIPPAVRDELAHPDAPVMVRSWISSPPDWLSIESLPEGSEDRETQRLGPGERESILLSKHAKADLLLLDDWKARKLAQDRGLPITGLIGVLDLAIQKRLVEAGAVVERLRATGFRASDQLFASLLR